MVIDGLVSLSEYLGYYGKQVEGFKEHENLTINKTIIILLRSKLNLILTYTYATGHDD